MNPLSELGRILVELQVISQPQFAVALAKAGQNLDQLLRELANLRADWSASEPALSKYQLKRIRKFYPKQLKQLKRLRIGDYLILDLLGVGGMGKVYRAWSFRRKEIVALKKAGTTNKQGMRRFYNEYKSMRQLSHQTIVKVLDMFSHRHSYYLAMELQNRGDLEKYLKQQEQSIPWRTVVRWAIELLAGLAEAHQRQIIHRDIKPSNIMLHQTPQRLVVRWGDWGLAKLREEDEQSDGDKTKMGQILGSFYYMAPEQWNGAQNASPASDIYSLGGSLFFALTGRPPFIVPTGSNSPMLQMALCKAHMEDKPPSLSRLRDDVPSALDALIQRMLAKKDKDRGTARDLRLEFLNLLNYADLRTATAAQPTPSVATRKGQLPSKPDVKLPSKAEIKLPTKSETRLPKKEPTATNAVLATQQQPVLTGTLTPEERLRIRDANAPLGWAFMRLCRAFWSWGTHHRGQAFEAAKTELGEAYRMFGRSLLARIARLFRWPNVFVLLLVLIAVVLLLSLLYR